MEGGARRVQGTARSKPGSRIETLEESLDSESTDGKNPALGEVRRAATEAFPQACRTSLIMPNTLPSGSFTKAIQRS